jgi:AraC-like DNA-binding protein
MKKKDAEQFNLFFKLPCINSICPTVMSPYWAEHWHTNSTIELIHIIKGKVKVQLRSSHVFFEGSEGDTLLVPPATRHKDQFDMQDEIVLFYIQFLWKPVEEYLKMVPPRYFAYLSKHLWQPISQIFEHINSNLASGHEIDSFIVQLETLEILLLILRSSLHKKKNSQPSGFKRSSRKEMIFEQACKYIQENYKKQISLEDVALSLRISPFYLSHIFNQKSNFSFNGYLNNTRLDKALQLLKDNKVNISEVSYAVGYDDNHYFSRIFKKKFGITPSHARSQINAALQKKRAK